MYKSILILISFTFILSSCYTQFALTESSTAYIPDVQYDYDDDDSYYDTSASDYEDYYEPEGYYSDGEYYEFNYYDSWYSNYYYYPSWGYYTGWYSPYWCRPVYVSPGYGYCPPYYNDWWYNGSGGSMVPVTRTPRSFDKGNKKRVIPKKGRNPRPNPAIASGSSGSTIIPSRGSQHLDKRKPRNSENITQLPSRNGGNVVAIGSSTGKTKQKTIASKPRKTTTRDSRRKYYNPIRISTKPIAVKPVKSSSTKSRSRNNNNSKSYNTRSTNSSSSPSYRSTPSHRSSPSVSRTSSSPSGSRSSSNSSNKSTTSRRRR